MDRLLERGELDPLVGSDRLQAVFKRVLESDGAKRLIDTFSTPACLTSSSTDCWPATVSDACVASDLLGKSGRAMLAALIDGTTNPDVLADLALGKQRLELPARARAFVGSARQVADYPTDEVLTALAPDARAFLQRTSVLDRFRPELREAVLGRHDSAARRSVRPADLSESPG